MEQDNEIRKELEELGSILATQSRSMPFQVPEAYFEAWPAEILIKALEADTQVPLPKTTGFTTPEGYFDQLPEQLLNAAKEADSRPVTIPLKRSSFLYNLKWAAAAIFIAGSSLGVYRTLSQPSYEQQLAKVPAETISAYVQQHMGESAHELVENSPSVIMIPSVNGLQNEEIIQYLDDTGWE